VNSERALLRNHPLCIVKRVDHPHAFQGKRIWVLKHVDFVTIWCFRIPPSSEGSYRTVYGWQTLELCREVERNKGIGCPVHNPHWKPVVTRQK